MSLGYFFVRGGVGVGHSVDEILWGGKAQRVWGPSESGPEMHPGRCLHSRTPGRTLGRRISEGCLGETTYRRFQLWKVPWGHRDPDPSSTVLASYWYSIMTVAMVSDEIG
ncbi:uncharacterized protein H6S33_009919 [Morchella sextelata]|uniref:uncharacterized protein n=1 Tax=Morchella sextelata TaxID=1174677 RepID=UPI001D04D12C|nr:uncharacterized protein H6S33_009919 [Morchella sextelata]KAH0602220.1 hypothetical protein H6S33_009919 [Morchella sextelata]